MEDVICVVERQEDYWCESSTICLKLVFRELNNSMLKQHKFPSIQSENDHSTASANNTEKETVVV